MLDFQRQSNVVFILNTLTNNIALMLEIQSSQHTHKTLKMAPKTLMRECLENFFVAKKRKHNDVKWRNMGLDNKKMWLFMTWGVLRSAEMVVGLKRPFKS